MEKFMNYVIVDWMNGMNIVERFGPTQEEKAREILYKLRKQRYIDEHPDSPEWMYDTMKHDNGYNLYICNMKIVA